MALRARLPQLTRTTRMLYAARWYSNGDSGGAGSIREAGGSFGKKEKAVEDQYFRRLEAEQLEKMRKHATEHHEEEITHHEDSISELKEQIRRHEEKIKRHQTKMEEHK